MASRSWNRVELIGNLTRDPEIRYTPSGAAVCTFSIATNRSYVTEGERREEVDFHRAVAWNKLAELCNQLLKKGLRVFISGRLQNRSWEGQDGQNRQVTEIVVEDMIVLSPKGAGEEYMEDVSHESPSSRGSYQPKQSAPVQSNASQDDTSTQSDDTSNQSPSDDDSKKESKTKPQTEEIDTDDLPF